MRKFNSVAPLTLTKRDSSMKNEYPQQGNILLPETPLIYAWQRTVGLYNQTNNNHISDW